MAIFIKIWTVHFLQQLYHIAAGRFAGPAQNWLTKPERYRTTAPANLQEQLDQHTLYTVPACLSIFLYKFVKVPYTLIYYMVVFRFMYSLCCPRSQVAACGAHFFRSF